METDDEEAMFEELQRAAGTLSERIGKLLNAHDIAPTAETALGLLMLAAWIVQRPTPEPLPREAFVGMAALVYDARAKLPSKPGTPS
jgi:hypothetical protein